MGVAWCDGAGSYGIVEQREGVDEQVVWSHSCGSRGSLWGDSGTGDLLASPVNSRASESSARVARKLPFIP